MKKTLYSIALLLSFSFAYSMHDGQVIIELSEMELPLINESEIGEISQSFSTSHLGDRYETYRANLRGGSTLCCYRQIEGQSTLQVYCSRERTYDNGRVTAHFSLSNEHFGMIQKLFQHRNTTDEN